MHVDRNLVCGPLGFGEAMASPPRAVVTTGQHEIKARTGSRVSKSRLAPPDAQDSSGRSERTL